tara:strand:- start:771 stop:1940 length:1170 start_codon:yes stop_codon:yes gene_type:complete
LFLINFNPKLDFRVIQIISDTNKSIAFEIIAKGLKNANIDIAYILLQNNESAFSLFLKENNIQYFLISINGKKSYPLVILKLYFLLRKLKPTIVHSHLRAASILGTIASKFSFVKHIVYTRHHSTSNHQYNPHSVKWDRLINNLSTHIVSISKNVSSVLINKENVKSDKLTLIHHGFDLDKFKNPMSHKINDLKNKYHIKHQNHPIIGVISRYVELKGLQYIIPAFAEIMNIYPSAHLVLANTVGGDSKKIKTLLNSSLNEENYTEIVFEEDLYSLYGVFDFFVHTPIDNELEAFGQTYVEALASKTPSVFTLSGVANEFIIHEENALVAPYCSDKAISGSLLRLMKNNALCEKLILNGLKSVQSFSAKKHITNHINLYDKLCHQKDRK